MVTCLICVYSSNSNCYLLFVAAANKSAFESAEVVALKLEHSYAAAKGLLFVFGYRIFFQFFSLPAHFGGVTIIMFVFVRNKSLLVLHLRQRFHARQKSNKTHAEAFNRWKGYKQRKFVEL